MRVVALFIFIIIQIAILPLAFLGLILIIHHQIFISKKLGVSSTAVSAIGNRWLMDLFSIRKDAPSVALYNVLPNGSAIGLWLLFLPAYLRYIIGGPYNGYPFIPEEGKEGIMNVPSTRTHHFDKLIEQCKEEAEQFLVMGAGYDTRCYGLLKNSNLKCFELDQPNTQNLKIECLKKAKLDASAVTFVAVDFATENWYDKLISAGYDPLKKSLFLWEGVTIYLAETDVIKNVAGNEAAHRSRQQNIVGLVQLKSN